MGRTEAITPVNFVANVGTPTVASQGTTGSTTYAYKIVAVAADGTKTAASSAGSAADGNATLDGTNFQHITWTAVTGAASYEIFRTTGGATQGKIGTATTGSFDDTGLVADGTTANATNGTGYSRSRDIHDLSSVAVQIAGTFVATIQLEGSIDGTNYFTVGSAQTGAAVVSPSTKLAKIRAHMTAYTSGTPVLTVIGAPDYAA